MRENKCKIFNCEKSAENVLGSHYGVCEEHSSVNRIVCNKCGSGMAKGGAYAWSKMRWESTTSKGEGACSRNKHEWLIHTKES